MRRTTTIQLGISVAAVFVGAILVSAQSGVFFSEGWESGSASGSFNSNSYGRATESQFSVQGAVKAAGNWALRHSFTPSQGSGGQQYATQHFGDARTGPVWPTGSGQHYFDLYVQWKVYYSPGFVFNAQYKQFIIGTEDDLDSSGICCNPWVAHYMTIHTYTNGELRAEANNKQSGNQWIDFWPNASGYTQSNFFRIQSGQWYTIEVRRKLNDAGVNNGIFQLWVGGQLIYNYTNVRFRVPRSGSIGSNFAYGTNFAMISDWAAGGVPQNQSVYYDDVKISTTYVGVGTATPPAIPTNLRITQ